MGDLDAGLCDDERAHERSRDGRTRPAGRGDFELGLGTQVRGNIVGRCSTPWTSPVPRMREYVESLRAIFHTFQTGEKLQYEGEHYQFTRLQPFFNPGPLEVPSPPILLGAVGPE